MLALIAGQGALPGEIVAALPERPHIASLSGFAPDSVEPDEVFRLEHLGTFLEILTSRGVQDVCFAGAVKRPPIEQGAIDAATMPLVPRMVAAMGQGDDVVLRTVVAIFEEAGLVVRGAHELVPSLLPEAGVLAGRLPDHVSQDVSRAEAVLAAMGAADTGQACVILKGQALALEGLFGTDWMLQSLRQRPDGRGGLLYKGPKPGQDRRIDLPTIGPATMEGAAAAGLDGVVIAANGVLVLEREKTLRLAEEHGLYLCVGRHDSSA